MKRNCYFALSIKRGSSEPSDRESRLVTQEEGGSRRVSRVARVHLPPGNHITRRLLRLVGDTNFKNQIYCDQGSRGNEAEVFK
jgi:hypothetical protein